MTKKDYVSAFPARRLKWVWLLAVASIFTVRVSAWEAPREIGRQNLLPEISRLTPDDKAELAEIFRIQTMLGDEIWPGLGHASIPIILYNERQEFLISETTPLTPWSVVEGDSFSGKHYYHRNASNPQAFAVRLGDTWAASMSTFEMTNRKAPIKMSREMHVVAVLHEMFHAFQARKNPGRFRQALQVYGSEARYPGKLPEFISGWQTEGTLLAAAFKLTDPPAVRSAVRDFLQTRDSRRARAGLSADLVAYERELEWLEGLATYVEARVYELAVSGAHAPALSPYDRGLSLFRLSDLYRLEKLLGSQDGDLRFYLSGMAEARMLDMLSPDWKEKAMDNGIYLEELLRSALSNNDMSR